MNQPRLVISLALLAPSLFAQDHTIAIKPQGDTPTRYTIEASSKVEVTRKTLINGEEMNLGGRTGGGGGGGGGRSAPQGPTSAKNKVVFVDGGKWRQYETVEAKTTRPGWDGESDEQTVTGELQGKKISLGTEPAVMDGEKSTPLAAASTRGLPLKLDLSGLAPNKPLAVNGTYEIGDQFKAALASLSHPVRAARPENAEAGGGGRRNRGGEGGEAGAEGGRRNRGGGEGGDAGAAGGEGRRGQRGMGGRMGGGGGFNAAQVLTSEGAKPKLTGKLVKVDNGIATIEINGEIGGESTSDKLGLAGGMGAMMTRRGGQGGDAAPPADNKANLKVAVTGNMTVDIASGQLQTLSLSGKVDASEHTKSSREGRDGETMEIESDATHKGEFNITVATAPAK